MTVRQRASRHTVFATSAFSQTQPAEGQLRRRPASKVHAKTMGTTVALCGQSTLSWFKYWDIPFVTVRSERCYECISAVAKRLASGQPS